VHDAPYIGLISGTSVDGIDAVLVQFESRAVRILESLASPYPEALRERLLGAMHEPSAPASGMPPWN
jgi:anhydro-N-acetylmuramic acid kinase